VDPSHLHWLATLKFGLIELDCALLHGSSCDVGDNLSAGSSPLLLLDRFTRMDVNRLFTAHSGTQFCVELRGGSINSLTLWCGTWEGSRSSNTTCLSER